MSNKKRDKEILKKFKAGATYSELAKEYGLSSIRIGQIVRKLWKDKPDGRGDKINVPIKKIIELYKAGLSGAQIASKFKISATTIHSILMKNDIPLRIYSKEGACPDEVARLKKKGLTTKEIAKMLNCGVGQVNYAYNK